MKYDISEVAAELDTLLHWTWWELKIVSDHLMSDPQDYGEEDYCSFKENFFELSVMLSSLERILGKEYQPSDTEDRPWEQQKHYAAYMEKIKNGEFDCDAA
jgi:hypothetical protein